MSEINMSDLVGVWDVPLNDGLHTVEFEHGTATGKRVIRVDGKEIMRKDWMFRLVGDETFTVNTIHCVIRIEPDGLFHYVYTLLVDGKSLKKFTECQSKICNTWLVSLADGVYRIVLEKDTLDIWVNGQKADMKCEFVDDGTETRFMLGDTEACIKAITTNKKEGIVYTLIINDDIIQSAI